MKIVKVEIKTSHGTIFKSAFSDFPTLVQLCDFVNTLKAGPEVYRVTSYMQRQINNVISYFSEDNWEQCPRAGCRGFHQTHPVSGWGLAEIEMLRIPVVELKKETAV